MSAKALTGAPQVGRVQAAAGTLAATAAGSVLVYYVTAKTGHGASLKAIGGVVVALLSVALFRSRRIDVALAVGVAYMGMLDGLLRLKTGSSLLTIGRDIILYAAPLGLLLRSAPNCRQWHWPPLTAWVLGWTVCVLVQVLNPDSGPTLHRIISLRQDLEFVPLFFLGYQVVRSRRELRAVLLLVLLIGAANGVVGTYQSTLTPAQLGGWGPGYYAAIHGLNGAAPTTAVGANGQSIVRPPGLGGDMGFGGAVGIAAVPAGIALLLRRRRRTKERLLIAVLLFLATVGVITSQSRASILSCVIGLLALAAMLASSHDGRRVVTGLAVLGAFIAVAVSLLSSNSFARYSSIAPSNLANTVSTSRSGSFSVIGKYLVEFPFGAGIGSSGPAYGQFGASKNTTDGEGQIPFLITEVGIPGLILFLLFQGKVLALSVRRVRNVRDPECRVLLAALIAPLFAFVANWYVGINTVSPPNAPYMWGAIGILAFWVLGRAPGSPVLARSV